MLDILTQVGLDPTQFLILCGLSAVVVFLAYWPFVFSLLDPLNMFIVAMIADAILMYGLSWDSSDKIEFTFFVVFFWIGFVLCGRIPKQHPVMTFGSDSMFELEFVLVFAFVVLVVANLYLGMTAGFPLFSADPSEAKVTTYTGGLGTIRHLNLGPYMFLCCGCTLMVALGRRTALALTMLVVSSVFVAFSGAKGALVPVLFVQGFVIYHKGLGSTRNYAARITKIAIPMGIAAVAIAIVVVVRDNGGLGPGLVFLAKRLLFFGDVILFYYPWRGAIPGLIHAGPIDYFFYLADPVLGMFRLRDYPIPLGTIISNSDLGFGPNVQYFVRADIFFGPVAGCVYCFVIGYLSSLFRKFFYTSRTASPMTFTFLLLVAVSALTLATESTTFVSEIADTALFIFPLWCFARITSMATKAQPRPHLPTA